MASNSWLQLTAEELEKQYQPSKWVKRVPPGEAVAEFVATISEQAARARETLGCCAEVRYGPGPEQRYRVLGTDVPDDAPLAVYIHGGYWQVSYDREKTGEANFYRCLFEAMLSVSATLDVFSY